MKKIFFKTGVLFLALTILTLNTLPAFAFGEQDTVIPIINVEGIASKDLYVNIGDEDETKVFWPEEKLIAKTVFDLIHPSFKFLMDKEWDSFGDSIIDSANELFSLVACNEDGTSRYNVSIKQEWEIPEDYDFEDPLIFFYDWRMDPMDNAVLLNDYIQFVKQELNSEKVALTPISMGGTVALAYLSIYGTDDIAAVIMQSSAFQGVSLVGELFTKNVEINEEAVYGYIDTFLKDDIASKMIRQFISAIEERGINERIFPFANEFIFQLKNRVYAEMLIEIFGYMPGLWSLVPDDYYEDAKNLMLDAEKNAQLIEKIDVYHYEVQCELESIMQNLLENNVNFAFTSHYSLYGVPLTPNYLAQTDYLIDTVYTSAGATVAKINETLGDDYIQAVDCGHNHISPDRIIDASTCIFPEYTWFVKNMVHARFNDDYKAFIKWVINEPTQPDVFSNPDYPQFMKLNQADNSLSSLSDVDSSSSISVFEKMLSLIKSFFLIFYNVWQ